MSQAVSAEAALDTILEARGICKQFGSVPVLDNVDLFLEPGTVTALAGENGAGKSTLLKIIAGQYQADKGQVHVNQMSVSPGIQAAIAAGIAIIPQELAAIPDMTVYENFFVGRELHRGPFLDRRSMIAEANEMISAFNVSISPLSRMRDLPVGMQQIVEIIKTTSRGARIILLDEPTSAIAEKEVEHLYQVVHALRIKGVAMVYTTHKMKEIRAIADRVVVLRDGGLVKDAAISEISDDEIVSAMIGRELEHLFPPVCVPSDEVVLEAKDLLIEGASGPVNLRIRGGEIVSLSGLVGSGRTELIEALFGLRPIISGQLFLAGRELTRLNPERAINAGIALVPEDRKDAGAILSMSVLDNGSLPRLGRYNRAGWLNHRKRQSEVGEAMQRVRVKSAGLRQEVGRLSGGNQQKVVLARWLTDSVRVMLLDEPTRGVDVGARSEIYGIIHNLAESGMAVLMASSDMTEVLGLSNRSLVMRDGVIVKELSRTELDDQEVQETIFRLSSGQEHHRVADTGAQEPEEHFDAAQVDATLERNAK